ncbi:MAG: Gfo/Idh/MocA family oxidoreductase [Microbacterium ginsengisoli]|jgi:predicted dehydrogenase|uniref:Gfo/Idh/MocA family protein n=3 Tax=Microbacteriaceae TaxID=85023 RepID=UPI0006FE248D|nr:MULTISPECIES: Gfo/Idh/MocA family oxidoreductase [unclassified Microbacterium]KQR91546.1 oxidoreductase [Microbacterium sp. Leaf347]MBN9197993.1 Gfo/Idh/MocA family oxidoreductase [Microbacterium ginsengisoli]OJU79132.1 MAG: oxidoreductase [Microbacterium sp. 71-23]
MSARIVNVGIIGGGLMGREIAAALRRWPALVDHPVEPRLVAVCDINPAAMEWFDGIDTVRLKTTDHRELLADPEIDVVYIAVRHDLHEQLYVDTIRAGKALLAEKPFGIDRAAADAVVAAIDETPDSFVRVSSEMPFFPGAQWAIDYVRSGALGRIVEATCGFLHASDLDVNKPLNWKRQQKFCGVAGVMNDLGMHTWHVPLRLGWAPEGVFGVLQDIVTERPGPGGDLVPCDTWDNAIIHSRARHDGAEFPLTTVTKRIAPGEKNTWEFEAIGMSGGVRFSTKNPKQVEVFALIDVPGVGREQSWQRIDAGSQSVWPTVTGPNFESGFSDAILQMWAAFLAEYVGELGDRFGTVRPAEAALTHRIFAAAIASHEDGRLTAPAD